MKKLISVCLAFSFALALCLTCYGTSGTEAAADTGVRGEQHCGGRCAEFSAFVNRQFC